MNAPVTPARAALHDLIATLQAQADLQRKVHRREYTDDEMKLADKLDARQDALEKQLQAMVQEQLGVDYATLWHAVTPSGPLPKLP